MGNAENQLLLEEQTEGAQSLETTFHHQGHLSLTSKNISFMLMFWPGWYRLQFKKQKQNNFTHIFPL